MDNIKMQPNRICDIVDREQKGFMKKTNKDPEAAIEGHRALRAYSTIYNLKLDMHKGG